MGTAASWKGFPLSKSGTNSLAYLGNKENEFHCWLSLPPLWLCGLQLLSWQPFRRYITMIRPKCGAALAQMHRQEWPNSFNLGPVHNMAAYLKYLMCGFQHVSKYAYTLLISVYRDLWYREAVHWFMLWVLSYVKVLTTRCTDKLFCFLARTKNT